MRHREVFSPAIEQEDQSAAEEGDSAKNPCADADAEDGFDVCKVHEVAFNLSCGMTPAPVLLFKGFGA